MAVAMSRMLPLWRINAAAPDYKLKDKFDHDKCENREVLWNLVAARA